MTLELVGALLIVAGCQLIAYSLVCIVEAVIIFVRSRKRSDKKKNR